MPSPQDIVHEEYLNQLAKNEQVRALANQIVQDAQNGTLPQSTATLPRGSVGYGPTEYVQGQTRTNINYDGTAADRGPDAFGNRRGYTPYDGLYTRDQYGNEMRIENRALGAPYEVPGYGPYRGHVVNGLFLDTQAPIRAQLAPIFEMAREAMARAPRRAAGGNGGGGGGVPRKPGGNANNQNTGALPDMRGRALTGGLNISTPAGEYMREWRGGGNGPDTSVDVDIAGRTVNVPIYDRTPEQQERIRIGLDPEPPVIKPYIEVPKVDLDGLDLRTDEEILREYGIEPMPEDSTSYTMPAGDTTAAASTTTTVPTSAGTGLSEQGAQALAATGGIVSGASLGKLFADYTNLNFDPNNSLASRMKQNYSLIPPSRTYNPGGTVGAGATDLLTTPSDRAAYTRQVINREVERALGDRVRNNLLAQEADNSYRLRQTKPGAAAMANSVEDSVSTLYGRENGVRPAERALRSNPQYLRDRANAALAKTNGVTNMTRAGTIVLPSVTAGLGALGTVASGVNPSPDDPIGMLTHGLMYGRDSAMNIINNHIANVYEQYRQAGASIEQDGGIIVSEDGKMYIIYPDGRAFDFS